MLPTFMTRFQAEMFLKELVGNIRRSKAFVLMPGTVKPLKKLAFGLDERSIYRNESSRNGRFYPNVGALKELLHG
jgi:hypothetical protein